MKPVTLHIDAEAELAAAVEQYSRQREGLAGEFLAAFDAAVLRIRENPELYAADDDGTRQCPLHRFPYTVAYLNLDDRVWVAAVAHQKRRPGYWARRRPD